MLWRAVLPVVLVSSLLAGALCDERRRLEPTSDQERLCRRMVACWYPGESGSQFAPGSPRWGSLADPKNAQNIRNAYGEDGSCWYVDPMAGEVVDGGMVEGAWVDGGVITEDAQALGCGKACACAIHELCAGRDDSADPAPECVSGAEDPCEGELNDLAVELCPPP